MSNQTFKAGDKVQATWRDGYRRAQIIGLRDNGEYTVKFTDNLYPSDDLLNGHYARSASQLTPITSAPYPEYAADLATYRDAVAAGAEQGQTGRMTALLRLIGHLLGEGK